MNEGSQGVKHPEIMAMLGFGLSNNKIEHFLNRNEADEFPGAFKPIILIKLP